MAWVTLLAGFTYVASRDANVVEYTTLMVLRLYGLLLGATFWVLQHPKSFLRKLLMIKDNDRNARNLAKELGLDKNEDWND